MNTFIVATTADPARPGLSYKIEMPPNRAEQWHKDSPILLQGRRETFVNDLVPNTVISRIHGDGRVETEALHLEWYQINELLTDAETHYEERQGPGRPERRVLVLTTSKERRTGALTARQGW